MQVADFILGNTDRHTGNWGFFEDNRTGVICDMHPLMDHDHAFSNDRDIPSQTTAQSITLRDAAVAAQKELQMDLPDLDVSPLGEYLTEEEILGVQERMAFLRGHS